MNSRDLFKKTHSAYESRQVFDGAYAVSARESGQVAGACASLKAICSPDATDQDLWHVVHLDAGSRLLLDSVAVLGASGQDQAAEWAMQDFGQHMGAVGVIGVASGSAIALRRVLDDGLQRGRVTQALLDSAGSRVTAHPVRWLDGVGIASHGGSMATLFLDMVRHDEDGLLLDAMTPADLMEGAEQGQFDALIVDYAHLEMMQNRLAAALSKVAANGLSVSGVTATKPFKRNGVAQVAVMFDFSDGQTFTAFFHNPDSTPAKLAPKDILTSWKFTLNKRDVTAVVQPEQGENVQMPKLASRIMQLVAKNSDRFKRANARKGEMAAQVQEVQARIDQKQAQLTELESDIADLQGRIDERLKAKQPASAESGGMASSTNNGKAEEWHTEVPTEGLLELKEEKEKSYSTGLVVSRIADDAVKAITKTQKLGNVPMYAYYLPSVMNTGKHGIVRLFPDDQNPGGNWKLLDSQVFHVGMMTDSQIKARLVKSLSSAKVLAYDDDSTGTESINPEAQNGGDGPEVVQITEGTYKSWKKSMKQLGMVNGWDLMLDPIYGNFTLKTKWNSVAFATEKDARDWAKKHKATRNGYFKDAENNGTAGQNDGKANDIFQFGKFKDGISLLHGTKVEYMLNGRLKTGVVSNNVKEADVGSGSLVTIQYKQLDPKNPSANKDFVKQDDIVRVVSPSGWESKYIIQKNESDPDRTLLEGIINGTTSAADVDMDALIAIAKKYDGNAEMKGLVNQALDIVTQDELTDAQKIEMVDKAYQFASATDEFKLFAANSQIQDADDLTSLSVEAEYDPLSTAVAMDKAAKKNGFAVKWQMFTEPGLNDELMARVYKGRKQIGRISMGGDGKAMVYVGASGDTRVTTPDGLRAVFSDDDAPYMIDWLANNLSKEDGSAGEASKTKQDGQNERADIQGATNSRRDPEQVSYFNPYMEGDIVSIGGQDWTVKQDTTGWYLTNNGNWRGAHPTIRDIKGMNDLISAILQAATASTDTTQEPAMNPDRDYLQSILDGDTDLSDGEAVEAELERIGENLTPELEALFERAVDAYAAYQVQQAGKVA